MTPKISETYYVNLFVCAYHLGAKCAIPGTPSTTRDWIQSPLGYISMASSDPPGSPSTPELPKTQPGVLGNLRSSAIELARASQYATQRTTLHSVRNSHWCLNGGALSVSTTQMQSFLDAVAVDYARGVVLCVVEVLTRRFRFFLDLDLVSSTDKPFEPMLMRRLAGIVQRCVRAFYPTLPWDMQTVVLCRSTVKPATNVPRGDGASETTAAYKHGYHLHMPGMIVDHCRALHIRALIVHRLQQDMCSRLSGVRNDFLQPFEHMVDEGMFLHARGSLRLQGADKVARDGRSAAGRMYEPAMVLGPNGMACERSLASIQGVHGGGVDPDNVDRLRRLLAATSVRTTQPLTPHFRIPARAPTPRRLPDLPACRQGGSEGHKEELEQAGQLHSADAQATLERVVRESFHGAYAHIRLCPARKLSNNCVSAKAKPGSMGSKRCHNLCGGGEHTSATVFFVLTPQGLYQRCFSNKAEVSNRRHGSCPAWNAKGGCKCEMPVDPAALDTIFGDVMGDESPPSGRKRRLSECES